MANVRVEWGLPNVTVRHRPIKETRIEFRADGITDWTVQANVPADATQELVFVDVAPGNYEYQATVIDDQGAEGAPAQTTASVPFDAPGTVTAFIATVE